MAVTLDQIADFPALVDYLRDELEWPIPDDIGLEEATYDVTPEEIGLKAEAIGGGIEIKQLRPLNRAQPWGVFFLNLPNARLPVTLVRNILGKLAVKKRASANKAQQAAFAKHDLLFIAATGSVSERRLAFAHFADDEVKSDAAILKVLGWDANDTPRRLGLTEDSLKTKLHWPENPGDPDGWRRQWGEAFAHSDTRTVIRDSRAMAKALAALARRIRERAKELIAAQTESGSLVQLHKAFKQALISDLTLEGFADTYAQTIAYGLLSAAISRPSGALVQETVTDAVHPTSPFLKEMLGTFIEAGGRRPGRTNAGLDFDELGIAEVVELLRNADMEAVLADFDRRNPDEDPVIHFYELFLKEYDAEQKVKRGVFYTPRPVVGFIVRSVDEVLRTSFGLEDGLASTETWGELIAARPEISLPEGAKESDPFVRILDPATGTGTFLVECVDLIHKTMVRKWFKEGLGKGPADPRIKALWNDYVPRHLLPRLTGFELMMAPYAIAHVKLGLKLADTGYQFRSETRAQIYLTNALEPARNTSAPQFDVMDDALAHEAKAANDAKMSFYTVITGNPPYNGYSANKGRWIEDLMEDYKVNVRTDERQIQRLSNDYVKFIRLAEHNLHRSGCGIFSFIVDSGFLNGLLFRDMRQSLLESYASLKIVDLHGESVRGAHDRDQTDQNVFDITQPNCVMLAEMSHSAPTVAYCSIRGPRSSKYRALNANTVASLDLPALSPHPPSFLFTPRDVKADFEEWPALPSLLGTGRLKEDRDSRYGTGIKSRHDHFAIGWDANDAVRRISQIAHRTETDAELIKALGLCTTKHFSIRAARRRASNGNLSAAVQPVSYRPFDTRYAVYLREFVCEPKAATMKHQVRIDNVALCFLRKNRRETGSDAMIGKGLIAKDYVSDLDDAVICSLWLAPEGTEMRTLPNIAPAFPRRIAALTGLSWDDCVEDPEQGALHGILPKKPEQTALFIKRHERGSAGRSFGPRDLFDYIYAVLHSPAYRQRYADYLNSDFARIPLPGSRALFEALVPIGTELVALHLLDAEALAILRDPKSVRLAGSGEARVAKKPEFRADLGRVEINATRWFETVPEAAWDFHVGGYQPAQKWLKDRAARGGRKASAGRVLSDEDILHYRRIVVALDRTAELMPKIDEVIEKHGGWPDAFRGMTD